MVDRNRRDLILQSACELFSERGYHATTIRNIADQCGLLSGSLYTHIRSKEDLLYEIADRVADRFLSRLDVVMKTPGSSTDRFRQALAAHILVVSEDIHAARVLWHEWQALSPDRRSLIDAKHDAYEQMWGQILQEGVARGEFHAEHLRYARTVTLSVANWLYQWFNPEGTLTAEEVADRLATVLLRGLHKGDSTDQTSQYF
ncbi:TetR/AcrR family transcriptional regulator [Alicyclobacillaceae bacterium I2511]|nr:TetR/AcrR family transcriptional regulator [Alicyclobacillaceae bacterium I2511]